MAESLIFELDEFEVLQDRKATIYVRRAMRPELGDRELILLPQKLSGLPSMRSRARTEDTIWFLPGSRGDLNFVVRKYYHGGLWGRMARDIFIGHERMLRELAMYEYAWKQGVPTCHTAALRIEHPLGPLCRGHLLTVKIENALNLEAYCEAVLAGQLPKPDFVRMSKVIADAIRKMHDCGIYHGDLNGKNILVRSSLQGPEAFVIDFDRAQLMTRVPLDARMANLLRLDRSIVKWPALRGLVTVTDRLRLVRDYLSEYPQWNRQWRSVVRTYRTHHYRHMLSYLFGSSLGPRPEVPRPKPVNPRVDR